MTRDFTALRVLLTAALDLTSVCVCIVCHLEFESGVFRFESDSDNKEIFLEVLPKGKDEYVRCITYPMAVEYPVHFFMASGGMQPGRRKVEINKIMFYDNEPEIEGEEEAIEQYSSGFDIDAMTISDLLISGQINTAIYMDEEHGRNAYNDNLMAYNGKYARLVGMFHANEEAIERILEILPTD